MDLVLQLLFTGIGIGAVYALVALGFVLIFRATNVVNFAQGEFSMVAAYLMVVFAVDLGWPYWLSFLLALGGMALLGAIFNLGVYYPLRHRTFLPVIIATIGASILLANSVLAIYGPQPQVLEGWFETPGIQLGPVYLDSQYLLIIAVTILLVAFNYWFFEHTMLGKKLQATSQDKEMASLLGISVSTMIMITFGGARGPCRDPGGTDPVRFDPDGIDDRAQGFCRHHHWRIRRRCRCDHRGTRAWHHRNLWRGLCLCALQGRFRVSGAGSVPGVPASGHLW